MKTRQLVFQCWMMIALAVPAVAQIPQWQLGPFERPPAVNPVITPDTNSVFFCPMRGRPVNWEFLHTFNPAAVVKDGQIWLLYRAEDNSGDATIGHHTSRLGLAISDDGLHFQRLPAPVLYPAGDSQKENEWDGGCEDPRLIETEDGTYVLTYTEWNHKIARLAAATSKNLLQWTKQGPVFTNFSGYCKSGAIVCQVTDGRLKAVKINGKYWMYWGEGAVSCASSDDLIHWNPGLRVLEPRPNQFDSDLAEAGPPAVLTDRGIVLLYNGKNAVRGGDPLLPPNVYADGQALFDSQNPTHLLARTKAPFYKPEASFERAGQYASGTTFIEGLVFFHNKWILYYGCADSFVAAAVWNPARP